MWIGFCLNRFLLVLLVLAINTSVCIRHGKVIDVNKKELSELLRKIKTSWVQPHDLTEREYNTSSTMPIKGKSLDTIRKLDNTINHINSTISMQEANAATTAYQNKHNNLWNKNQVSTKITTNSANNLHVTEGKKIESNNVGVQDTHKTNFRISTSSIANIKDTFSVHNISNDSKRLNGITPYPVKDNDNHKTKAVKRPIRPIKCPTRSDPRKLHTQY